MGAEDQTQVLIGDNIVGYGFCNPFNSYWWDSYYFHFSDLPHILQVFLFLDLCLSMFWIFCVADLILHISIVYIMSLYFHRSCINHVLIVALKWHQFNSSCLLEEASLWPASATLPPGLRQPSKPGSGSGCCCVACRPRNELEVVSWHSAAAGGSY